LSDGPNSWPLAKMEALLASLKAIDSSVKASGVELDS
jgi:2-dehydro-3-deoxyphosphooctonate aldolase (KDO 8-P synthase)